ncbi:hypothetical protein Kpho01_76120 [Kitasatospora phosalacinea]|uniref:Uncharacterized protein n=1 Tax=Kitasatospora phosalacinea TaxID=2065 RepID=A0A9W6PRS4_9ACTN|nr:hypothetical protein Kpho01_76120 [Kitasatospora phosalacinea]
MGIGFRLGRGFPARDVVEVIPLVTAQAEDGGEIVEHFRRGRHVAGLFQICVPSGADPGEYGDFLPPEAGGPTPEPPR